MQWLYDFFHSLFSVMFAFFGKVYWLIRNSITFQIAVITSIFTVGVILWRMFYYGIRAIVAKLGEIQTALHTITGISTVGDILDLANFIFPVEEVFAMTAILVAYGAICLMIRIIRSFIPTMT